MSAYLSSARWHLAASSALAPDLEHAGKALHAASTFADLTRTPSRSHALPSTALTLPLAEERAELASLRASVCLARGEAAGALREVQLTLLRYPWEAPLWDALERLVAAHLTHAIQLFGAFTHAHGTAPACSPPVYLLSLAHCPRRPWE